MSGEPKLPTRVVSDLADKIYEIRQGFDGLQNVPLNSIIRLAIASANTHLVFAERFLRWALKGKSFSGVLPPPFTG